jgi:hypothetical protein
MLVGGEKGKSNDYCFTESIHQFRHDFFKSRVIHFTREIVLKHREDDDTDKGPVKQSSE